jgi:hypothetical protein
MGMNTAKAKKSRRTSESAIPDLQLSVLAIKCTAISVLLLSPVLGFFNQMVTSNGYSGTLGAGASTCKYRMSISHNPAGLEPGHSGFSLSHYSPYGISEIKISEAGAFWDFNNWGISLTGLQTSMVDLYLEHTIRTQGSFRIYRTLFAGAGLDIRRLEIAGFGYDFYPGESFGLHLKLWDRFSLGCFVSDIFSRSSAEEDLFPTYDIGFSLNAPKGYSLDFDIRRDHNRIWRHVFSQTLVIRKVLEISMGMADKPYRFSIGAAIHFKGFGIFHAVQMHGDLGLTRYYGLQGVFNREKQVSPQEAEVDKK